MTKSAVSGCFEDRPDAEQAGSVSTSRSDDMRSIPFLRAQFDRFSRPRRSGGSTSSMVAFARLDGMPGAEVDAQHHLGGSAGHSDDLGNHDGLEERHDRVQREPDAGPLLLRSSLASIARATAKFDSSDALVGTFTLSSPGTSTAATLDQSGQPATGLGSHQLTIPLPQGLPPFPEKPYVLVVADPSSPSATADPAQTASFRTYTIGIVTHGGIQDTSWKHGPPWELQIAYEMKQEGYDAVIPYNWVAQSNNPGEAIKQSPKLARIILHTASKFPASAPGQPGLHWPQRGDGDQYLCDR